MKKDSGQQEIVRAIALITQLGFSMAACIFIGVLGGHWLDRWLGTSPWLLIVCVVLGTAAAFKVLYDMTIKQWTAPKKDGSYNPVQYDEEGHSEDDK